MTWQQAVSGDREAQAAIIAKYQGLCVAGSKRYSISSGMIGDSSDAAQLALVYAWECLQAGTFEGWSEDEFKRWMFKQGMQKSRHIIRRSRAQSRDVRRSQTIGELVIAEDRQAVVEQAANKEAVENLLASVDELHQEIFRGLMLGMSAPEIGETLGMTGDAVQGRINRFRKKLRETATAQ